MHQPSRHLGFEHVVEAGRATASVAVVDLDDLETRDLPQHGAWLGVDVLCAEGVAGVVVRDRAVREPDGGRLAEADVGEELQQVVDRKAPFPSTRWP